MTTKRQAACIRIFEYDALRTGEAYAPDAARWEQRHWERLAAYKQRTQCPYFEILPQRVQFGHYVGLLQVEELTIEILPKLNKTTAEENFGVQSLLLQMVFWAEEAQATALPLVDLAQSVGRNEGATGRYLPSLLRLYWRLWARELEGLLRGGLARAYRQVEGERRGLRGRLLLQQTMRQPIGRGHMFCTRASEYDENQHCNRLLKSVLLRLSSLLRSTAEGASWARLCDGFARCEALAQVSDADFEPYLSSPPNRASAPYLRAMRLARLLANLYEPTLSRGDWEGIALMYDMNRLWESYLSSSLQAAAPAHVRTQAGKPFWRMQAGAWQQLRADVFYAGEGGNFVADCKWKSQSTAADWRQLYVYAHYFGAAKAFLLLPAPATQREAIRLQRVEFAPTAFASQAIEAAILWIQPADEMGQLRTDVGTQILQLVATPAQDCAR